MPRKHAAILCLALSVLLASLAHAHGDREKPLFVAPDGVDAGRCQNTASPCRTINYALRWVGKGGQIRIARGAYDVTNTEDLFQLIGGDIDIRGGYDPEDGFSTPSSRATTLTGVPTAYADLMSKRGFHVVVDRKGIDHDMVAQTAKLLAVHESLKSSIPATPCDGGSAGGLPCNNVDLLSHVGSADISANPGNGADVWGFVDLNSNREYAIVGFQNGTAVFDVTDAENPREIGFIDGQNTAWRDIKVYQFWNTVTGRWNAHAYVTTDGSSDGLFVIDLSGLPHNIRRLSYPSDFSAAHNVYATNTDFGTGLSLTGDPPTLVIAGSNRNSGPYRAYSVDNPASPSFEVMPGSGRSDYMHDAASMIITDSRKDTQCVNATTYCEVLFDFNELTFDIWDITDTTNPVRLNRSNYPNVAYVHSGWWSEDKQYVYVHDELDERDFGLNTTLRVFSLADLTAPVAAGDWVGPTRAIDHNGFVRGNRYYMSNYSRGLTVLDLTDPANPVSVGRLDTYPASDSSSFVGAWGAYPFFHSGNIAISDIGSGFYMAADRTLDVTQGSLSFGSRSFGGEEGTTLPITVRRNGGAAGSISVGYEIVPATGSSLDVQVASGALIWGDADSSDKVISIELLADTDTEDMERMLIKLVAPTGGATLAPDNVASVYVSEPGVAAIVEFDQTMISTAERGFATAVAVIRRIGSSVGAASVDYSMSGGNADAGVDFAGATSGNVIWADGDADPKWIEFAIIDDGSGETAEFVEFSLSNAVGANVGSQATLRINIADGTGINSLPNSVAGASQTVSSGAAVTLDGSQSNDPEGDTLTFQWTQIAGTDVTLSNAGSAIASFTAPTVSSDVILRFQLSVTDSTGLNNTSTTAVTVTKPGGKSSGGGGSLELWMLILFGALLIERMLFDNRLLAARTR
ncbi:MAG: choice-of-anchor B family protein [Gammaproteobacteria bacterium]|nr:choice-of-anchor B family protein [Gammaproteobacteria bacterium]MDH3408521.1 choice-of-anchor B family protein [Gammaproteobacteria bacterium]